MEKVIHKASQRGSADHGWLKATHSFSFANYFDSEKVHFGKLRVLNDDEVAPSKGFDLHPHQNMEIITIPLSGSLRHGDNMGNEELVSVGDVQVMSAGSGIWHSEFNASDVLPLKLFQIWIFTDKKGHKPRYEQKTFSSEEGINNWQLLVSPKGKSESLWIHQEAFISQINTQDLQNTEYQLNKQGNGVYFMVVNGEVEIEGQNLRDRDALGVSGFYEPLEIHFLENSKLLAIEIPMR